MLGWITTREAYSVLKEPVLTASLTDLECRYGPDVDNVYCKDVVKFTCDNSDLRLLKCRRNSKVFVPDKTRAGR